MLSTPRSTAPSRQNSDSPARVSELRSTPELRIALIEPESNALQRHQRFISQLPDVRLTAASHSTTAGAHHLLSRYLYHDLAIIGISPQNHTALRLMRQMRTRDICTPVIIISALSTPQIVHTALSLGAIDYLVTPVSFMLFAQRVRQARWYCEQQRAAYTPDPTVEESLSQQHIDEILEVRHPRGIGNHLNGVSPETLDLVRHTLLSAPHSSASHIAQLAHTSRVTARRYLEYLVSTGHARRTPQHGQVGRPSSLYHAL